MRLSAKASRRQGAFGDPGSGAEKVTAGLAPFVPQTAVKSGRRSQPRQETVTLSPSASPWLRLAVTAKESSHSSPSCLSQETGAG